ncbi:MAG: NrdH-redoxin [Methanothrix sp.]|jgi:glutaredoxin|uniref:NrdH-redoxin n=1 Tax=Methanothrix soehngenii TaxID=2223 RepID=A0A7K4AIT6_METSH|nr:NrdH-redoxin [Methanothrix sp.]NLJ22893.1 NrdH-redoxin [Methanothrix soehngenii]
MKNNGRGLQLVYRVYSTKSCPKCEQLKAALVKAGIAFENIDMGTPEALTELRINGVFTLSAPVLQEEDNFYTLEDLFSGDNLRDLAGILKG